MTDPHTPPSSNTNKPTVSHAQDAEFSYVQYDSDQETAYVTAMRQLISADLSEPYSIYVYRYFLYQWGELCFMAFDRESHSLAGVVVSKLEPHQSRSQQQQQQQQQQAQSPPQQPPEGGPNAVSTPPPLLRGYIAMLAVCTQHRGKGIATRLVRLAIDAMIARDAAEIVLETEVTNTAAIKLYERLGFLRSKKLHRYYLNGNSAFRLVLYLKEGGGMGLLPPSSSLLHGDEGDEAEGDGDTRDGLPVRENKEYPGYHVC